MSAITKSGIMPLSSIQTTVTMPAHMIVDSCGAKRPLNAASKKKTSCYRDYQATGQQEYERATSLAVHVRLHVHQ